MLVIISTNLSYNIVIDAFSFHKCSYIFKLIKCNQNHES